MSNKKQPTTTTTTTTAKAKKGEKTMKNTTTTTTAKYSSTKLLKESAVEYSSVETISESAFLDAKKAFLISSIELERTQKSITNTEKQRDNHGDKDGTYKARLSQLRKEEKRLATEKGSALAVLSEASYHLNGRETNQAILRAMHATGDYSLEFEGDDKVKYNKAIDSIANIANQFCIRVRKISLADDNKTERGYVSLLDKNEFKTIRNNLKYISFGMFGNDTSCKFTPEEVIYVALNSIISKRTGINVRSKKAIRTAVLSTVACHAWGEPEKKTK